jgi:hypothetical protein
MGQLLAASHVSDSSQYRYFDVFYYDELSHFLPSNISILCPQVSADGELVGPAGCCPHCDQPAVQREVQETGSNKGRRFVYMYIYRESILQCPNP